MKLLHIFHKRGSVRPLLSVTTSGNTIIHSWFFCSVFCFTTANSSVWTYSVYSGGLVGYACDCVFGNTSINGSLDWSYWIAVGDVRQWTRWWTFLKIPINSNINRHAWAPCAVKNDNNPPPPTHTHTHTQHTHTHKHTHTESDDKLILLMHLWSCDRSLYMSRNWITLLWFHAILVAFASMWCRGLTARRPMWVPWQRSN